LNHGSQTGCKVSPCKESKQHARIPWVVGKKALLSGSAFLPLMIELRPLSGRNA
jgi:hypothetical protein